MPINNSINLNDLKEQSAIFMKKLKTELPMNIFYSKT